LRKLLELKEVQEKHRYYDNGSSAWVLQITTEESIDGPVKIVTFKYSKDPSRKIRWRIEDFCKQFYSKKPK